MKITYRPSGNNGFTAEVEGLRKLADGTPEMIFAIRLGDENATHAIRAYIEAVASDITTRPEVFTRLNEILEKAVLVQASHQCRRPDCDVKQDVEEKAKVRTVTTSGTGITAKKKKKAKKKAGKVKA